VKIIRVIHIILIALFVSGCAIEPMAPSDFPYALMLQASDLPQGFIRTGGSFPQMENAFSHIVGYSSNPQKIATGISHQITIYPTSDLAIESFPRWEDEWLTNAWAEPTESYEPLNPNDISVLKCMDIQIDNNPSQSCTYLQQHENLVILVLANIDSQAINFQQFLNMLDKLDSRLPSAVVPMPKE
jgi:hypothetical protein